MNRTRMIEWLLLAVSFYMGSMLMYRFGVLPEMQGIGRKLGHITVAAYLGYWIDRHLYRDRLTRNTPAILHIRRAVIVAACILAVAMGL